MLSFQDNYSQCLSAMENAYNQPSLLFGVSSGAHWSKVLGKCNSQMLKIFSTPSTGGEDKRLN